MKRISCDASYQAGCNYYKKQQYQDAINEFSKALEFNPKLAEAYEFRGCSYYFLEDPPSALKDLNKAIELNPNSSNAFCFRGACYCATKKFAHSSDTDLGSSTAYEFGGFSLDERALRELKNAIEDEKVAIKLDKNNLQAFQIKGCAHYWLEKWAVYDRVANRWKPSTEEPEKNDSLVIMQVTASKDSLKSPATNSIDNSNQRPHRD